MLQIKTIEKLFKSFPRSFINDHWEFIAHKEANEYFLLENCKTELDVKCKVLEWFSRGAHKTEPFYRNDENKEYHQFMLRGINTFLETNFTEEDIAIIYQKLGNRCKHNLTVKFITSGYDMSILKGGAE